jgi:hypothetical protein
MARMLLLAPCLALLSLPATALSPAAQSPLLHRFLGNGVDSQLGFAVARGDGDGDGDLVALIDRTRSPGVRVVAAWSDAHLVHFEPFSGGSHADKNVKSAYRATAGNRIRSSPLAIARSTARSLP